MLGRIEGRRRGRQRMRWLDGIIDSRDMTLNSRADSERWWWTGKPIACCSPRGHKKLDVTERLNNNRVSRTHYWCSGVLAGSKLLEVSQTSSRTLVGASAMVRGCRWNIPSSSVSINKSVKHWPIPHNSSRGFRMLPQMLDRNEWKKPRLLWFSGKNKYIESKDKHCDLTKTTVILNFMSE